MKQKLLIADDQNYIHRLIRHELEREGYELIAARNGGEMLDQAMREAPALVVVDVIMRKLDGLAVLRQLKREALTQSIPVIVLTSSPYELVREEALNSGADAVLLKPFSGTQLLAEIRRLVPVHSCAIA